VMELNFNGLPNDVIHALGLIKNKISNTYNDVKILKSPNRFLQETLFLMPLISLRPFFCIFNRALLSFTPTKYNTIF
jgi:hypothetical protein